MIAGNEGTERIVMGGTETKNIQIWNAEEGGNLGSRITLNIASKLIEEGVPVADATHWAWIASCVATATVAETFESHLATRLDVQTLGEDSHQQTFLVQRMSLENANRGIGR